jgi:hypothetical protein
MKMDKNVKLLKIIIGEAAQQPTAERSKQPIATAGGRR